MDGNERSHEGARLLAEPPVRTRRTSRRHRAHRARTGQSLVEFALILPVTLVVILAGLDFGRAFLGWIELHQMARDAADFAAMNPEAWQTPGDPAARAEYARELRAEAANINCALPSTLPIPSFQNGVNGVNGIGSPVSVSISCRFDLITPIMSTVMGSPVQVSAGAAFPVRNGTILGVAAITPYPTAHHDDATPTPTATAVASVAPTATPASSVAGATATPTAAVPTPTPSPTPEPSCRVPFLVGNANGPTDISWADDLWRTRGHNYGHNVSVAGAGFVQPLVFNSALLPNSKGSIKTQDKTGGTWLSCTSTVMTVTWGP